MFGIIHTYYIFIYSGVEMYKEQGYMLSLKIHQVLRSRNAKKYFLKGSCCITLFVLVWTLQP